MTIASELINSCPIITLENINNYSGKLLDSSRYDDNSDKVFAVYQFPDKSELVISGGIVSSRTWKY